MAYVSYKDQVRELEEKVAELQSKLDTFFSGDIPQGATFDHMILAKYGRMRLLEKRQTAALLAK